MRKKFFFLGILLGVCLASPAQFYSARTNLIGLATGNINLEGSMTLNRRWSLHLPVQYNPFVFKDNRQCKHSASCVFFSPLFLPTFVASL